MFFLSFNCIRSSCVHSGGLLMGMQLLNHKKLIDNQLVKSVTPDLIIDISKIVLNFV